MAFFRLWSQPGPCHNSASILDLRTSIAVNKPFPNTQKKKKKKRKRKNTTRGLVYNLLLNRCAARYLLSMFFFKKKNKKIQRINCCSLIVVLKNPDGRVSDVQGSSHSWVTPSLGLMAGHHLPLEIFGKLGDFKCWNRVRKGIFVDCYDHPLWTRLAPNNPPIHHALDPILAGRNDFVKVRSLR